MSRNKARDRSQLAGPTIEQGNQYQNRSQLTRHVKLDQSGRNAVEVGK